MSNITFVQILKSNKTQIDLDYKSIIHNNLNFLKNLDKNISLEYIVYDNLESFEILESINFPPFREGGSMKYFRNKFTSLKHSFLESAELADSEKIIFLDTRDVLNAETINIIRPTILKNELFKINFIKNSNFKFVDFNLLIKPNKTFLEKIKLLFKN